MKNKTLDEYLEEDCPILFINGDIEEKTYLNFAQELRYKLSLGISPIKLYINSGGGELESALAIIDDFSLVESKGKEIWTIAIGQASSSAALILAYGSKRFATPNSVMMLHPISYDLGENEHQSTKTYVNFADKVYNNIMTSLAVKCGRKQAKQVQKFIREVRDGLWLDVDEAKNFGLIDDVWDYSLE